MKIRFCGADRRSGISRKSGNPYDICELSYLAEIEPKRTDDYTYKGFGFQVRTFDMRPDALDSFQGIKLGQEVEVTVEPQPDNPRRTWVTGLE